MLAPGIWVCVYELRSWHDAQEFDTNADLPIAETDRLTIRGAGVDTWHLEARCQGMDDALFFGTETPDQRPSLTVTDLEQAQKICMVCPVKRECLTHALVQPEQYGIWGGTSGRQRSRMHKLINAGQNITTIINEYLET